MKIYVSQIWFIDIFEDFNPCLLQLYCLSIHALLMSRRTGCRCFSIDAKERSKLLVLSHYICISIQAVVFLSWLDPSYNHRVYHVVIGMNYHADFQAGQNRVGSGIELLPIC